MTRINKRKKVFKLPLIILIIIAILGIGIFTYSFGNLHFEKTIDIVDGVLHSINGSNQITYNSLGGSQCDNFSYIPGVPLSNLCQPVYSGYTFGGWIDENHEYFYNGKSVPERGNIELTATWVADSNVKCRRATSLHTALCNSSSSYGCRKQGLTTTSTITYGNISTTNSFEFGDAYDCDVDGDGMYDPATERFYYITDLEGHDDVAVLLYYNNISGGYPKNNVAYKWFTSNVQTSGPATAAAQLPKNSQWMNVNLEYPVRDILDNSGAVKKSGFDYTGYSARLLTYQELINGSGNSSITVAGDFDNYSFLLENTQYDVSSSVYGYWLETGNTSAALVYNVNGRNRDVTTLGENGGNYGVRPAIEVPKSQIYNGYNNRIKVSYMNNGGTGCVEKNVIYKGQIGELCTPVKDGYTFAGWFDKDGNSVTASTVVDNPDGMDLYAEWRGNILCRRATTFSTALCNSGSSTGCRKQGFGSKAVITYGNGTISDHLLTGNPLICDVNGDGFYDETLERFYYVTDLEGNSDVAVLIASDNVTGGVFGSTTLYKYFTSNNQTNGPVTALAQLPTTTQWPNVRLSNPIRNIVSDNGTLKKEGFSYEGYAARLLTYDEVNRGCGITLKNTVGILDNCSFLLENTQYQASSGKANNYWLETATSANTSSFWYIQGTNRHGNYQTASSTAAIRPAIEVNKSDIDLNYYIRYDNNGGEGCSYSLYYDNQIANNLCIPHRDTYYFAGWIDKNNHIINNGDVITCNNEIDSGCIKELTASWSKTPIIGAEWLYTVTNSIEKFTVPVSGVYLISAKGGKGAQSGSWAYGGDLPSYGEAQCSDGSVGGAVRGKYMLNAGTELYVIAGGAGTGCSATNNNSDSGYSAYSSSTAGFNGLPGAARKGAGGGASQVAYTNTLTKDTEPNNILISAYGGTGRSGNNQSGINFYDSNALVDDTGIELGLPSLKDGYVYIRLLSFN